MNIKNITAILFIIILVTLVSCKKDFDEINTNPNSFTSASDGALFNEVVSTLQLGWNEQFYIHNEILYKQTQQAALFKEAWGNFTLGTEEIWSNYYGAMPEIRELEKRFSAYDETPATTNMKAMLKILFAMKTFKVTDLFGDIPFTEAGYGFQDIDRLHPKYDSQRDIYITLLDDLKWADDNIDDTAFAAEPFATFRKFDKLFNGDMTKWRKMANSLRLRHAMRIAEVEPGLAGDIIKEIIENNRPVFLGYDFITPVYESACLWPVAIGFRNESVSWSFREHKNLRMGSTVWRQLSAHDSADGSGIFDPRAYVFFETDNSNEWRPYPQLPDFSTPAEGGIPYGSQRDAAAGFPVKGETCIYSPFNYFIITDGDYVPIIIYTGAETHFIKAEAYFRGIGVGMDPEMADIEYMNGINTSVEWWMGIAGNFRLPISRLAFPEMIQVPGNLDVSSVLDHFGSWNAATDEEKLRYIYTQWWLDAFRQPWEAYALARRTGKTPREGDPIAHYRLPYPPSEVEYNSENCAQAIANQGGDSPEVKLWWTP